MNAVTTARAEMRMAQDRFVMAERAAEQVTDRMMAEATMSTFEQFSERVRRAKAAAALATFERAERKFAAAVNAA